MNYFLNLFDKNKSPINTGDVLILNISEINPENGFFRSRLGQFVQKYTFTQIKITINNSFPILDIKAKFNFYPEIKTSEVENHSNDCEEYFSYTVDNDLRFLSYIESLKIAVKETSSEKGQEISLGTQINLPLSEKVCIGDVISFPISEKTKSFFNQRFWDNISKMEEYSSEINLGSNYVWDVKSYFYQDGQKVTNQGFYSNENFNGDSFALETFEEIAFSPMGQLQKIAEFVKEHNINYQVKKAI